MARCLKSEGLKGDGTGCIKPGGHGGRCKVRDEPKRRYLAGGIDDTPAPRRGAKPGRHTGGGGLKDLARIVDRVEAEVHGLIADADKLAAVMREGYARLIDRNAALLKSLVASRKELQRVAVASRLRAAPDDPSDPPDPSHPSDPSDPPEDDGQ